MTRRAIRPGPGPDGSPTVWIRQNVGLSIQRGLAGRFGAWAANRLGERRMQMQWTSSPVPVTKCHTHSGTPVAWPPEKKLEGNDGKERIEKKRWCGTVGCCVLYLAFSGDLLLRPRIPIHCPDVLTFLGVSGFPFQAVSPAAFSLSLLPPSSPLNNTFSRLYPYSGLILCGLGPLHSRLTCDCYT